MVVQEHGCGVTEIILINTQDYERQWRRVVEGQLLRTLLSIFIKKLIWQLRGMTKTEIKHKGKHMGNGMSVYTTSLKSAKDLMGFIRTCSVCRTVSAVGWYVSQISVLWAQEEHSCKTAEHIWRLQSISSHTRSLRQEHLCSSPFCSANLSC